MKRKIALVMLVGVSLLLLARGAYAVPQLINYQGRLTDSGDNPINGTVSITFTIYEASTGGTDLWHETQQVEVEGGLFNVLLGSANPIQATIFDGSVRFLGIKVGIAPEMTPRHQIVSVGYAFTADNLGGVVNVNDTGNVGIGTTEPVGQLHILGNEPVGDGEGGVAVIVQNTGDGYAALGFGSDNRKWGQVVGGSGTGEMSEKFGIIDVTAFAPRLVIDTSGNVGIGTASPTTELDVSGTVTATAFVGDGSELTGISGTADSDWVESGANVYRETGNVGIGTTEPPTYLTIVGTGTDNEGQDAIAMGYFSNGPSSFSISGVKFRGTPAFPAPVQEGDNLFSIDFRGYDDLKHPVAAGIYASVDGTPGVNDMPGRIEFLTSPDGTETPQVRMAIRNNGNVGIGTTSPTTELDVSGTVTATAFVGDGSGLSNISGTADSDWVESGGNVYRETGNVGIGTRNPDYELHVYGSGIMGQMIESKDDYALLSLKSGKSGGTEWVVHTGYPSAGDFMIADVNSPNLNQFIIKETSGNVGIGTPSPGNILTIVQSSTTNPIADAWTQYSSKRWKTNIRPIENALDKVIRLKGVYFDWKADGKHDIGMIAEEVGEVIPEVVAYEENGVDAKSVDYARLVAVLVEAVKEQQNEIETLKQRIEVLESK